MHRGDHVHTTDQTVEQPLLASPRKGVRHSETDVAEVILRLPVTGADADFVGKYYSNIAYLDLSHRTWSK